MTSSLTIDDTLSSPNAHNSGDRCAVQGGPRSEDHEDLQDEKVQNLSSLSRKETARDGSVSDSRKISSKSSRRAHSALDITSKLSSSDDSSEESDAMMSSNPSDPSDSSESSSESSESSDSSRSNRRSKGRSLVSVTRFSTRTVSHIDRAEKKWRTMFLDAASVLKLTLKESKKKGIRGRRLFDAVVRELKSGAKDVVEKGESWTSRVSAKSLKQIFPNSLADERVKFGEIVWRICKSILRSQSGALSEGAWKTLRRGEGSQLKKLLQARQRGSRGEPPAKKRKVSVRDERYYRDILAKVEVRLGDTVVTYDSVLPKVPFSFFKQAVEDVRNRYSSHDIPNKYWVEWGRNLVKGALNG